MLNFRERTTPLVVIYNNLELFGHFLQRASNTQMMKKRYYRGDRAIFWLGDPKLVVTSSKIENPDRFCATVGYPQTQVITPFQPSLDLSLDVLREPDLLMQILNYAGNQKTLTMVPYATTRQFMKLVNILRSEYGLTVLLPESPDEEHLWVRDYIDTKSGFRSLATSCLPNPEKCIPEGYHCTDRYQAAEIANDFLQRNIACVVKADHGESGLGLQTLYPGQFPSVTDIYIQLEKNSFLDNDLIIVERLIPSSRRKSPSLEFFVPAVGEGDPYITYLSEQLFIGFGNFSGILIAAESLQEPWYPKLAEYGLTLARKIQAMGYQGQFDLDAIVDDQDQVWLLEINSRRTGGTFVHEYARYTFGDQYLKEHVILSDNKMQWKEQHTYEQLVAKVGELAFPIHSEPRGILITVTSALAVGEYGCFFIDKSVQSVRELYHNYLQRDNASPGNIPAGSHT